MRLSLSAQGILHRRATSAVLDRLHNTTAPPPRHFAPRLDSGKIDGLVRLGNHWLVVMANAVLSNKLWLLVWLWRSGILNLATVRGSC